MITFAPFDDQIPIGCLILWKSRHGHLFAKAIHYHHSRELTLKQQSKSLVFSGIINTNKSKMTDSSIATRQILAEEEDEEVL